MVAVRFTEVPGFVGVHVQAEEVPVDLRGAHLDQGAQPGVRKYFGEMLVDTEQHLVSIGTDGPVGDAVGHGRKRSAEIFRVNRERTFRPVMQLNAGLE